MLGFPASVWIDLLIVPLLPVEAVTSPLFEHGALIVTALGALVVAYASWTSH